MKSCKHKFFALTNYNNLNQFMYINSLNFYQI